MRVTSIGREDKGVDRGGLSKRRQAEGQKIYLGPVWAAEGQGITE